MAQSDSAGTGLESEVWKLVHPRHGTLEVVVGVPAQLRSVDPDFPLGEKGREGDDNDDDNNDPAEAHPAVRASSTPGFVLLRDGAVVARSRQIGDHKVSITADPPESGETTTNLSAVTGPRMLMRSSVFNSAVRQVTFREGREIVHFDPPPGSEAEARLEAIAASPWKRVVYPLAAGVGKSGWAIAMILLLPVLGRLISPVINWVTERIPDIDIPWPDISLPSIPWPDISLPSIDLPEVTLPGWVEFLLEYSKVWIPLLIGVAIAVVAVRQSRRSHRIRKQWEADQVESSARSDADAGRPVSSARSDSDEHAAEPGDAVAEPEPGDGVAEREPGDAVADRDATD